jgi:hypothetical protein
MNFARIVCYHWQSHRQSSKMHVAFWASSLSAAYEMGSTYYRGGAGGHGFEGGVDMCFAFTTRRIMELHRTGSVNQLPSSLYGTGSATAGQRARNDVAQGSRSTVTLFTLAVSTLTPLGGGAVAHRRTCGT